MLLILNLAGTSAGGQAPAQGQRVLVLYSDDRLLPMMLRLHPDTRQHHASLQSYGFAAFKAASSLA